MGLSSNKIVIARSVFPWFQRRVPILNINFMEIGTMLTSLITKNEGRYGNLSSWVFNTPLTFV
jgi:hypothetical protein